MYMYLIWVLGIWIYDLSLADEIIISYTQILATEHQTYSLNGWTTTHDQTASKPSD